MRQTRTLLPILTTIFTTMVIFTRVGIADTFPLPSEEFAPQTQEVSDRFGLYSSEERPATVGWNYSGALRFLHAPQGISLGRDGTLEESVELFFESNEDLLGIDVNQLVLASSHELVGAGDLLVFQQTLEGVPVYGGFVKVMIGLDRHVISVNSRYVSGLVLCDGCQSVLSANADNDNALLFVNFTEESLLALPATRETVEEDSILYERLTSLVDGQTLAKTQITEFLDEGTRTIKSHAYHNKTYSTTCANDAGCDVADCTPNCKCELEYFDFLGNTSRCVKGCGSCPPSYSCAGTTGAFRHFCKNTSASINNTVTIMDHGTWQSPYEQYLRHVKLGAVATWLQNIIDFHYLGLKRDGWLNMAGTVEYKVDVLAGTTDWGDVSGSSSIGSDYIILAEDIWKDISIDPIRIMSHEFGHLISTLDANGSVGHDYCLSESHANMMASLAVRYWSLGDWLDDHSGLKDISEVSINGIPYAHRSRFDWLRCPGEGDDIFTGFSCSVHSDCRPYETCLANQCKLDSSAYMNYQIWRRFLRALADGSDTFASDGNGEDVGWDFDGIGLSATAEVMNIASLNLVTPVSILDEEVANGTGWIELLRAAGTVKGVGYEVDMALDVAGFVTGSGSLAIDTDKAPRIVEFTAWDDPTDNKFFVYKEKNAGDIHVYYYDNGYIDDEIAANTDSSPAVVEYNNRLYIFWRDQTTSAVKYKYYRDDGYESGIYNLSSKSIYTSGSFDAAIYQNSIVLAFSYSGIIYVAKCSASPCYDYNWFNFGSGYKKSLNIAGDP